MSVPAHDLCLTADEYLALEETASERHEFVAGRVFAKVGSTEAHNAIVANLCRHLYDPVKQAGCHVYSSDMKLRIEATNSFYYPDVMVTCEPFNAKSVFKTAPCIVVEVLSPSTSDIDRREKLIAYRHLPGLVEYLLVYQDKKQIEVYRKEENDDWRCTVFSGDAQLPLTLPGHALLMEMDLIYSGLGM